MRKKEFRDIYSVAGGTEKALSTGKEDILIADNYVIHKSAMTQCFLKCNPKFEILFQPAYHPWVNKIELVWKHTS